MNRTTLAGAAALSLALLTGCGEKKGAEMAGADTATAEAQNAQNEAIAKAGQVPTTESHAKAEARIEQSPNTKPAQ